MTSGQKRNRLLHDKERRERECSTHLKCKSETEEKGTRWPGSLSEGLNKGTEKDNEAREERGRKKKN